MLSAEILCLGNELLIGRTVNKNSTEIALALTKLGLYVQRSTTIRDEFNDGLDVIQKILARRPDVLCITGGLGPTHDDIQLDIVAHAIGDTLVLSNEALQMLKNRFEDDESKITEVRRKMAYIPKTGKPLKNQEGSAPGVLTTYGSTLIFSLPGVPAEMRSILMHEVIPIIRSEFNITQQLVEYGFDVRGVAEADISRLTDKLREQAEPVNFKSHPKKDDSGYWLSLHTYLITDDEQEVLNAAKMWKDELLKNFEGVSVGEIRPVFDDHFDPE